MKILYCKHIPPKGFDAVNIMGLCVCRRGVKVSDSLLRHEKIHTAQMREMLYVFFYIWYVAEWLFRIARGEGDDAYRRMSFEREAYGHDSDRDYLSRRKHYAWLKCL